MLTKADKAHRVAVKGNSAKVSADYQKSYTHQGAKPLGNRPTSRSTSTPSKPSSHSRK